MRFVKIFILNFLLLGWLLPVFSFAQKQDEAILVRVFHLQHCKACIKVISDIIPPLAKKYGDKVRWEYFDLTKEDDYKVFLELQQRFKRNLGSPVILIGDKVFVGMAEIADSLDLAIDSELKFAHRPIFLGKGNIDLLERFKSFGPLAVIIAGLEDGINPCAFTVIVFFVSFLTLMGYRRKEMALIGSCYILGVFLTYLGLGFGIFKILFTLKIFHLILKVLYSIIGLLSLVFGSLALYDYYLFKKTGKMDDMALQLPRPIKNKIHAIVGSYYRKDKNGPAKNIGGLLVSSLLVGFMVSLIEAVCTGQMYLPTIVFILKEGTLRTRALFYLIVYNLMFILPLVLILLFALRGASSKQFEAYAKKHMGFIKLSMAAIFFVLAILLLKGM